MHPTDEAGGELAPAKVNLALAVTGQRRDGYHRLESLVVFTAAGDRLSAASSARDAFKITGPYAAALGDSDPAENLVVKAREALRRHLRARGLTPPAVSLTLEKNLPVASGIGGGSADAAAALRLLCRHWQAEAAGEDLAGIARELGADVPMCLENRPLLAHGIGDEITPLSGLPRLALVLANPNVAVATPAIFRALQRKDNPPLPPLPAPLSFDRLIAWLKSTRNDLSAPAIELAPEIATCLTALEAEAPCHVGMSGSGASCYAIHRDLETAHAAAGQIKQAHPDWFVTASDTLG